MKRSGCERLFLALAWLVLLSGCGKSSRPPVSPLPERNLAARPWQGCLLPRAPEGACEGRWGNTRIACNPDRFLDPERFAFEPDSAPAGFPLEQALHVQWHIMLREDGRGDVEDAAIAGFVARANEAFEGAGFRLETARIQRHRRGELARCAMVVDERVLSDASFDMCGDPSASAVSVDPEHYVNIYVLDLEGPTAFATAPCIYPPGDSRDGAFVKREVFFGEDRGVLIHELGHYFGLLHPFQNWRWAAPSPGSRCQDPDNDFVKDTPPQQVGLSWPELDCRNPPTTCEGSETPDSVSNFMQYGPCVRFGSSAFTAGQYRRMQWTLVGSRLGLIAQP